MGTVMDLDVIRANVWRVIQLRTFLQCTSHARMHAHKLLESIFFNSCIYITLKTLLGIFQRGFCRIFFLRQTLNKFSTCVTSIVHSPLWNTTPETTLYHSHHSITMNYFFSWSGYLYRKDLLISIKKSYPM